MDIPGESTADSTELITLGSFSSKSSKYTYNIKIEFLTTEKVGGKVGKWRKIIIACLQRISIIQS